MFEHLCCMHVNAWWLLRWREPWRKRRPKAQGTSCNCEALFRLGSVEQCHPTRWALCHRSGAHMSLVMKTDLVFRDQGRPCAIKWSNARAIDLCCNKSLLCYASQPVRSIDRSRLQVCAHGARIYAQGIIALYVNALACTLIDNVSNCCFVFIVIIDRSPPQLSTQ